MRLRSPLALRPVLCHRHTHTAIFALKRKCMHSQRFPRTHRYLADHVNEKAAICNKARNDTKGLAHGVFVLHCLDCAACIGFHMMPSSESPRTLFEILFTRWPTAPEVVVYDNGCHAHAYALNREPEWASNTFYVIDKLHYRGHTACSSSYDIGKYPVLGKKNSSMAEQKVRERARCFGFRVSGGRVCVLASVRVRVSACLCVCTCLVMCLIMCARVY